MTFYFDPSGNQTDKLEYYQYLRSQGLKYCPAPQHKGIREISRNLFYSHKSRKDGLSSWCNACDAYARDRRTANRPLTKKQYNLYLQAQGLKHCPAPHHKGERVIIRELFNIRTKNLDRLTSWCKQCISTDPKSRETSKDWKRKNPDKVWAYDLKKTYSMTSDEYNLIYELQNGLCAICSQLESLLNYRSGEPRRLCVDHNHQCCSGNYSCGKCIRGLLCSNCNIGNYFENPSILRAAADYHEFWIEYYIQKISR